MVVCVCRGLNEAQVRALIRSGSNTLDGLAAVSGAGTCCGSCAETLCCLLDEAKRPDLVCQPLAWRADHARPVELTPAAHRRIQGADHEVPPSRSDR